MSTYVTYFASPIGRVRLEADDTALLSAQFVEHPGEETVANDVLKQAERELRAYFDGTRRVFTTPLHIGGTAYQRRVWNALREIAYGETVSYAELAGLAGNARAFRAAGTACGRNAFLVFIPCHRVITSDQRLGGYGGRLDRKRWLLRLEGVDHVRDN
jgi:methylated-DNA-[protein]-cysteine S-methyltransferase